MKKIDMSSDGISRRLRQVDQLRYLCLSLMKAKKKPTVAITNGEKKDDRNRHFETQR